MTLSCPRARTGSGPFARFNMAAPDEAYLTEYGQPPRHPIVRPGLLPPSARMEPISTVSGLLSSA
jgi:hypothetical protein